MLKKLTLILVLLAFIFTTVPAYASEHGIADEQSPVVYERIINVDEHGGVYKIGFVIVKFPKDFIDDGQLPVNIKIELSSVNGVPGIEFTPDIPVFNQEVTIIVLPYNGLMYDSTSGENLQVDVTQQKFSVEHFSRYAFS